MPDFAITLIGPGGAGKSTVAALLAERLGIAFVDLDRRFADRAGDISEYINHFGYDAYARENVETYRVMLQERTDLCVAALSSGFMTYRQDIHPEYMRLRQDVEQSRTTIVLIPSLDFGLCVAETVRRQLIRPFAGSPTREEAAIRERFRIYVDLPNRKIETMQPPHLIVDEIVRFIGCTSSESNRPVSQSIRAAVIDDHLADESSSPWCDLSIGPAEGERLDRLARQRKLAPGRR